MTKQNINLYPFIKINTTQFEKAMQSLNSQCVSVSLLGDITILQTFEKFKFYCSVGSDTYYFGNKDEENLGSSVHKDSIQNIYRDISNVNLDLGEQIIVDLVNGSRLMVECSF